MRKVIRLTKKSVAIIERVSAGQEQSYDELNIAATLWGLTQPWASGRFISDLSWGSPIAMRLISLGYIEIEEDTSSNLLKEVLDKEERKYDTREIFPDNILISSLGKRSMDNYITGKDLTKAEEEVAVSLWYFAKDESNVAPWAVKKLLDEGYLTPGDDYSLMDLIESV